MEKINIREAKDQDLPQILKLYSELGMDDGIVLNIEEANKLFEKIKSYPDYKLYVAITNNEIVGTFALLIMDNLAHNGASSGIIEDVVVKKSLRGLGIGTEMMNFAVQILKNKKCYKLMLSSNLEREDAHKFYEKLGLKKHGYSFFINPSNYDINSKEESK